jgi:hypothetical protein
MLNTYGRTGNRRNDGSVLLVATIMIARRLDILVAVVIVVADVIKPIQAALPLPWLVAPPFSFSSSSSTAAEDMQTVLSAMRRAAIKSCFSGLVMVTRYPGTPEHWSNIRFRVSESAEFHEEAWWGLSSTSWYSCPWNARIGGSPAARSSTTAACPVAKKNPAGQQKTIASSSNDSHIDSGDGDKTDNPESRDNVIVTAVFRTT